MKCREAVETIIGNRNDAVVVTTMTAIKWVDEIDKNGLNVACVPLMGGASALGVGIALAQPMRKVFALDGDGSLLMQLPSLVMTCEAAPKNFVHFLFNNGVWFENMANLPIPGSGRISFPTLAQGAGYKEIFTVNSVEEFKKNLPQILSTEGPVFVELVIQPESAGVWKKGNDQPDLGDIHFTRFGSEIKKLRQYFLSQIAA